MSKADRYLRIWEVLSITTAAPGWRAVYVSKDDPGGYFEMAVACWAVLRITSGCHLGWDGNNVIWEDEPMVEREVHAMTIEDGRLTPVEPDEEGRSSWNFWGLLGPGEGIERLGAAPVPKCG